MSFTPTMAAVRNWYDLPFLDLGAVTVPTHSIHALLSSPATPDIESENITFERPFLEETPEETPVVEPLGRELDLLFPTPEMTAEPDPPEVDFLSSQFRLCFEFVENAATRLQQGKKDAAAKAIAHAEEGYQALNDYLTDPTYILPLTADQAGEFKAELQRLRQRLDGLQG